MQKSTPEKENFRTLHFIHNTILSRPRFLVSLIVAITIFCLLISKHTPWMSFIISWNAFSWSYILFLAQKIMRHKNHDIRHLTRNEDESARMVLFFLLTGCCASLLVLFFGLGGHDGLTGDEKILQYVLTASTLISSWLLLPMGYTMHYAHLFYSSPDIEKSPWLLFPDKITRPGYFDFMYFSFTIAVASQTADVEIASTPMRRAVLLQSIVSFIFNMAILGLCINISASLF
ncbi:DUF1345 domain-containing protein [Ignatzschineria cameli]|uniref:DUF1345 domain-containing protein n=1 Tax=Ignatzschineria cameli TaxID=2182793 RepID=UPI000D61B20C|nr:DUF1345 domain-containing protein [Ignatzschineria cameli]PWD85227.1 DUF1345 domain-containing protein [Ignatzschineria cameli]